MRGKPLGSRGLSREKTFRLKSANSTRGNRVRRFVSEEPMSKIPKPPVHKSHRGMSGGVDGVAIQVYGMMSLIAVKLGSLRNGSVTNAQGHLPQWFAPIPGPSPSPPEIV